MFGGLFLIFLYPVNSEQICFFTHLHLLKRFVVASCFPAAKRVASGTLPACGWIKNKGSAARKEDDVKNVLSFDKTHT